MHLAIVLVLRCKVIKIQFTLFMALALIYLCASIPITYCGQEKIQTGEWIILSLLLISINMTF